MYLLEKLKTLTPFNGEPLTIMPLIAKDNIKIKRINSQNAPPGFCQNAPPSQKNKGK